MTLGYAWLDSYDSVGYVLTLHIFPPIQSAIEAYVRVRLQIKGHSGLEGQSAAKYVVVVKKSIWSPSLGIQLSSHKFIALESH